MSNLSAVVILTGVVCFMSPKIIFPDELQRNNLQSLLFYLCPWIFKCKTGEEIMTLSYSTDETWGRITNAGFVTCCIAVISNDLNRYIYGYRRNYTPVKIITTWRLLQDEQGAQLEPAAAGADSDHFNGVSGSASSTAPHHPAGPKKRRHRIPRQEKDKDQHVGGGLQTAAVLLCKCAGRLVCGCTQACFKYKQVF